jgi:hypothetical protein
MLADCTRPRPHPKTVKCCVARGGGRAFVRRQGRFVLRRLGFWRHGLRFSSQSVYCNNRKMGDLRAAVKNRRRPIQRGHPQFGAIPAISRKQ